MTDGEQILTSMLAWLEEVMEECTRDEALDVFGYIDDDLEKTVEGQWAICQARILDDAAERDREHRMRPALERAHAPEVPGDLMKP